jgi:fucose 4-O-acetylase-like acetyltransferase
MYVYTLNTKDSGKKILIFFVIFGDKNSPKSLYFKYVYLFIYL